MDKVTKNVVSFPSGFEPDYFEPKDYCGYRFALGKMGKNPLVAICMNPSAASDTVSDKTINRIISASKRLGKDGWVVFNTYPERATDAKNMEDFNEKLSDDNVKIIKRFLTEHNINEVWGAWGNDNGHEALIRGRKELLKMLNEINVKVFYYGSLTKAGNPRHPLQRQEKWSIEIENEHFLME